jgi:AcrR family transcriptional regulator
MRTSQARERMLAAAVDRALDTGIADLSLRQLAAAIGTSHRMLLYHFGSREALLAAVTKAVEDQQRAALLEPGTTTAHDARHSWQRLSDPKLWPQERLFFELYSYALLGRPGTEGFLDGIVESWVAPVAAALVNVGAGEPTARADARLGLAVARGLLLDLLAAGDRARVGSRRPWRQTLRNGTSAVRVTEVFAGLEARGRHPGWLDLRGRPPSRSPRTGSAWRCRPLPGARLPVGRRAGPVRRRAVHRTRMRR